MNRVGNGDYNENNKPYTDKASMGDEDNFASVKERTMPGCFGNSEVEETQPATASCIVGLELVEECSALEEDSKNSAPIDDHIEKLVCSSSENIHCTALNCVNSESNRNLTDGKTNKISHTADGADIGKSKESRSSVPCSVGAGKPKGCTVDGIEPCSSGAIRGEGLLKSAQTNRIATGSTIKSMDDSSEASTPLFGETLVNESAEKSLSEMIGCNPITSKENGLHVEVAGSLKQGITSATILDEILTTSDTVVTATSNGNPEDVQSIIENFDSFDIDFEHIAGMYK